MATAVNRADASAGAGAGSGSSSIPSRSAAIEAARSSIRTAITAEHPSSRHFTLLKPPAEPPLPVPGMTDIAGKIQYGMLAGVRDSLTMLRNETKPAHPLLNDATKILLNLFTALNGHSRAELLFAVKEAKNILKIILANPEQHSYIFLLPDPGKIGLNQLIPQRGLQELIEQITQFKGELELYSKFLKGKKDHACNHAELQSLRTHLTSRLLTPEEHLTLIQLNGEVEQYQGLLAKFIRIKKSQQGKLDDAFQTLIATSIRTSIKVGKESLGFGIKAPPIEDIDLPKEEVLESGEIRTNHTNEASTLGKLIEGFIKFCKSGNTDIAAQFLGLNLLTALESAKRKLQTDWKSLLSATATEAEVHPIIASLDICITLLQTTLNSEAKTSSILKGVFSQVKAQLCDHHTLWIGSLTNLGITPDLKVKPITTLLNLKQRLAEVDPRPTDSAQPNYREDSKVLAAEVAEIGSYQATFEACSYLLGKRANWVKDTKIPILPFSTLLTQSGYKKGRKTNKKEFVEALQNYLAEVTDIGFFRRLWIKSFVPSILWLCEHCITSLKDGAFTALQEFVDNARDRKSGVADVKPIQRLGSLFDRFIAGHRFAVTHSAPDKNVGMEKHLNRDPDFLETDETGCKTLKEIYAKAGDTAIRKFMGTFNPTRHLSNVSNAIHIWAADSKYKFLVNIYTIITFPVTFLLGTINKLIVLPIEWIANKITTTVVTMILKQGSVVEYGHTLLKGAIFPPDRQGRPTNSLMNQVIINLLRNLIDLLSKPSEEADSPASKIKTESSQELSKTICTMLTFLGLKEQVHDATTLAIYDAASAPSGLSPVIEQLYRLLRGKGSKSLDMQVASAMETLIRECYDLLMDRKILDQQIVFALTSIRDSMIADSSKTDEPQTLPTAPAVSAGSDTSLIAELKTIAIQLAAHLTHDPLTQGGDHDKPIRDHVVKIKQRLLPAVEEWKRLFQSNPTLQAFDKPLFEELGNIIQELEDDLLRLKAAVQEGTVGSASLKQYETFLTPLIESLKTYEAIFSPLYTAKALTSMTNKEAVTSAIDLTMDACQSLQTPVTLVDLSASVAVIIGSIETLKAKLSDKYRPLPLREFLDIAESLTTQSAYSDSLSALEKFKKFSQALSEDGIVQIQNMAERKTSTLLIQRYFNTINEALTPSQSTTEILTLQTTILQLIERASTGAQARSQIKEPLAKLQALVSQTEDTLITSHQAQIQRIEGILSDLNERATAIKSALNSPSGTAKDDASDDEDGVEESKSDEAPDPRPAIAHQVVDIQKALDTIAEAATKLEAGSSLTFPLDWFPLFNTTESKIVSILEERATALENIILKNPQLIMGIIHYLGVIKFVQHD